ncbi:hypothetical protein XcuCFBP2542_15190 [Xanthomonas cucurbitae]|uniref:Uncharacterized protein n=1 Tax=Xanthomonas cucurbitae TaxID=56453 RepID=A0A2S7DN33_9XANT|nr:hypothetical protein XcuCFBP2542_15190 [Xanthomonas cucurbitae]QHG87372.1 hypothetical protein EBN15_10865 [Xanthomonas cucurbitae]
MVAIVAEQWAYLIPACGRWRARRLGRRLPSQHAGTRQWRAAVHRGADLRAVSAAAFAAASPCLVQAPLQVERRPC